MPVPSRVQTSLARSIFNFYLFGNIHIAICAVALAFTTSSVLDLRVRMEWLYVIFGGTLALYSYQRWIGVQQKENVNYPGLQHQWNIRNSRILLALTVAGIVLAAVAVFSLKKQTWFVLLLTAFLSLLYSAPIIPSGKKRIRLRDIAGVKIFLVALTWTLVCVWVPVAESYEPSLINVFSAEYSYVWKWSLVCFLLIFALTIPFDIRDIEFDKCVLRSLPMIYGERRIKKLAMALMLLSAFLLWRFEVRITHDSFPHGWWRGYTLWAIAATVLVSYCTSKRNEYYFAFWVDGMILFIPLAVLIN